jgi:hypothetical protein
MDERETFELIAKVQEEADNASRMETRLAIMESLKTLSSLTDRGLLVLGELWVATIDKGEE